MSRSLPLALALALGGCGQAPSAAGRVQANLLTMDDLDFYLLSKRRWDLLDRYYTAGVTVHWPDGHSTQGRATQVDGLKTLFVFSPDLEIVRHLIKFGSKEWTCVCRVVEGVFTQPLPLGHGKTAVPTGRSFTLPLWSIAHWNQGKIDEEWLFWDNQALLRQLGLEPPGP